MRVGESSFRWANLVVSTVDTPEKNNMLEHGKVLALWPFLLAFWP